MFYECTLIVSPSLTREQLDSLRDKIKEVMSSTTDGKVLNTEYWGFKTLTYPIQKGSKAHYLHFGLSSSDLSPLYDYLKFHQSILRYLIVKYPKGLTYPTFQMQANASVNDDAEDQSTDDTEGALS